VISGFVCIDEIIQILDVQVEFTAMLTLYDRERAIPDELPHTPYWSAEVGSGLLEGVEPLAQGILNPVRRLESPIHAVSRDAVAKL